MTNFAGIGAPVLGALGALVYALEAETPPKFQPKRARKANLFQCDGACGDEHCQKTFDSQANLDAHLGLNFVTCPFCTTRKPERRCDLYKHLRRDHQEKLDKDGGCRAAGMKPKCASKIPCPARFRLLAGERVWKMLTVGGGYAFLVQMVYNSISEDVKRKRWGEAGGEVFLRGLARTKGDAGNQKRHALAQEILKHALDGGMFEPGALDDAGGVLPDGFVLRKAHSTCRWIASTSPSPTSSKKRARSETSASSPPP